jgi:hypothetical protein
MLHDMVVLLDLMVIRREQEERNFLLQADGNNTVSHPNFLLEIAIG